jgi:hypothetical protein
MVQESKSGIIIRVSTKTTKGALDEKIVVGKDDEPKLWKALLTYFENNPEAERLVARTMPMFWVYIKGTKRAPNEKMVVSNNDEPKLWKTLLKYFEENPNAERLVARRKSGAAS